MSSRPSKNIKFNGYKDIYKDNKRSRKSLFKSKRNKNKKLSIYHQKSNFLNQK